MLVNLIQTFDESGRRWFAGENPEVSVDIANRWIADAKASADITLPQTPPGGLAITQAAAARSLLAAGSGQWTPASSTVVMASPPTIGAASAGNAATTIGAVDVQPWVQGAYNLFGGPWVSVAGAWFRCGYWSANTAVVGHGGVECILNTKDATGRFEFLMIGTAVATNIGARMLVKQSDGSWQRATAGVSLYPASADGILHRFVVTMGAAGKYTLRFDFSPAQGFGGIGLIPGDTLSATQPAAGRDLLVCDSYGGTISDSGGTYLIGADALGNKLRYRIQRDILVASAGGCGWVYKGGGALKKVNDYLAACITQAGPFENVIFGHGYNDIANAQLAADVATEATTAMQTVRSLLPNAGIRVLSPWKTAAATTTLARHYAIRDVLKTVCELFGGVFVDLSTKRNRVSPVLVQDTWSAQPTADVAASAVSIIVPNGPAPFISGGVAAARANWYAYVKDLADPTTSEVRKVTAMGSADPRTLTVAALTNAHAAASTVIAYCGPGTITGTGKQGTTAGDGNADWAIGTDGIHPTDAGHDLYADEISSETLYNLRVAAGLT